jgi:hypothetical protein
VAVGAETPWRRGGSGVDGGGERRDGAGGVEAQGWRHGDPTEARGRRCGADSVEERGRWNGGPVRGDVGAAAWTGEGGGGAEGRGEAAAGYVRSRRASKFRQIREMDGQNVLGWQSTWMSQEMICLWLV